MTAQATPSDFQMRYAKDLVEQLLHSHDQAKRTAKTDPARQHHATVQANAVRSIAYGVMVDPQTF